VKCAMCRQDTVRSIMTITSTNSFRQYTVNICRQCLVRVVGGAAMRDLEVILTKAGWVQDSLPF
jgi:hypothetical protein